MDYTILDTEIQINWTISELFQIQNLVNTDDKISVVSRKLSQVQLAASMLEQCIPTNSKQPKHFPFLNRLSAVNYFSCLLGTMEVDWK